jgi:hypothetical protein
MFPLIALLGGALLIGRGEVHRFESLAAADIASRLGGSEKHVAVRAAIGPEALFGDVYRVTIKADRFETEGIPLFTEPKRSQAGILRNLDIDMTDFSLRGLHVQSLKAEIPDCRFDFALALRHSRIRLTRSGVGPAEVVLSAADIQDFTKTKLHELTSLNVRLDRDKILVEGHGEFLMVEADFSLVARLEPEDGTKLALRYARVLLDGKPASDAAKQVLLDLLNPVIDLDNDLQLHGAIQVAHLKVGDGRLVATGTATIPDDPNL